MGGEIVLTEANFDAQVLKAGEPVLVDFWAEWCGPCRMLAPTIEELAREYAGRVKVGKVNVDQNATLAERYGIRGIPTVMLFKNGQIVEQTVGVQSKDALQNMINKNLPPSA